MVYSFYFHNCAATDSDGFRSCATPSKRRTAIALAEPNQPTEPANAREVPVLSALDLV